MLIGVPTERASNELRVALVPDSVGRLAKAGAQVVVERGAGQRAGYPDAAFEKAGAGLGDTAAVLAADLICKVQKPTAPEIAAMKPGAHLISLLQPASSAEAIAALETRGVSAFSLEQVPRTTRAQAMDVLSSQATIAGYKAVLMAAERAPRILPMLTTAAGTMTPATVLVLGAGVAGLSAIGTAKRLGAVVEAFDVRAAAAEQVESLGAKFIGKELLSKEGEGQGGYAKQLSQDAEERNRQLIAHHAKKALIVIATAAIPKRRAPLLMPAVGRRDDAARRGDRRSRGRDRRQLRTDEARPGRGPSRRHDPRPGEARGDRADPCEPDVRAQRARFRDQHDQGRQARRVRAELRRRHRPSLVRDARGYDAERSMTVDVIVIFVLAAYVGFEIITKVPPQLHTPLMSGTNAITGIAVVGAMLSAGAGRSQLASWLGLIAMILASMNVVGGFLVTDRMLKMFGGKKERV
jgi:NAD(P) transhydrogenase subunit alpha